MIRTKARLREKAWWPGMDKQVEETTRACHLCQLVGPRAKPEPVRAILLKKTDAQPVIKSMEAIFGTHGLPETVRSDNGPQPQLQLKAFLEYLGIEHKKCIPCRASEKWSVPMKPS